MCCVPRRIADLLHFCRLTAVFDMPFETEEEGLIWFNDVRVHADSKLPAATARLTFQLAFLSNRSDESTGADDAQTGNDDEHDDYRRDKLRS